MGTTSRRYNRHSRRAAMSNTAIKSRKLKRDRNANAADGKQKSSFSFRKSFMYAFRGFLGIFGLGKGGVTRKAWKTISFTIPLHQPPWRSDEELAIKKRRHQKRRNLIMTRGYA